MAEQPTQQTNAMLAAVWTKNRDILLHRLDSIESFCVGLPSSVGDERLRMAASSDAHKLAGSLGMFGLTEGTRIAREIEYGLRDGTPEEMRALDVPALLARLRGLIEQFHVAAAPPEADNRRRLLVLEADAAMGREIAEVAERRGVETRVVEDVPAARQALQEQQFDVLVLDLSTAELSRKTVGEDYGEQVRDLILSRAPMQVLALTSVDTFEDRVTAAQVGAHGFLPKTVPASEIVDTCEHLLDLRAAKFKVLVVDDDLTILHALKELLEQHAIRVSSVADARMFWNALEESAPDMVILDLEMPNFSGLELCRAIRHDPQWNRMPILFLSTTSDPLTITSIFSAGADDFVSKPIIGIELITRVRNRLERDRLHRTFSDYDQLTGVRNRRSSNVVIANYLRLAERHGLPVSLAVIDLDKFKRVNDTYGHQAGDDVLQFMGSLLRQSFRSEDVVARWGGEEFVIAMFAMRRADATERLANVLEALEAHEFTTNAGTRFRVSYSAGLAEFPADAKDLHSLYRLADEALYRAKKRGGRRIFSSAVAEEHQAADVAIVSSDVTFSAPLRHLLEMRGYSVELFQKPEQALAELSTEAVRVVLLDEMPVEYAAELVARWTQAGYELPKVIAIHSSSQMEASPPGVETLSKPLKTAALMQSLRRMLSR